MKKWMYGLALAVALVCGGCSNSGEAPVVQEEERTEQGVSAAKDANDPLAAEWSEAPVMVQAVKNAGVDLEDEGLVLAREGGLVFEEWDQELLKQIRTMGGEDVIVPQHVGHDLDDACYGIDRAGTCWVEWPGPPDAQDGNWYLYVQADGEEPLLLDEGVYDGARYNLRGNGVVMDAFEGNVIWTKPDGDYFVKLYRAETGETVTLDRFANAGAQVAIGADDAVWVKRDADQLLYLMHCDLKSGEVTPLEQLEEGADNPVLCGRFVVMHKDSSRDLWVYDLSQQAWTLHIGDDLPVFGNGAALDVPFVLDDRRIALVADTKMAPFQLVVVDLAQGKAYPVETNPYTPFYYFPLGAKEDTLADVDEAVSRIQPVFDGDENMVMLLRLTDDGVQKSVQPYQFLW